MFAQMVKWGEQVGGLGRIRESIQRVLRLRHLAGAQAVVNHLKFQPDFLPRNSGERLIRLVLGL